MTSSSRPRWRTLPCPVTALRQNGPRPHARSTAARTCSMPARNWRGHLRRFMLATATEFCGRPSRWFARNAMGEHDIGDTRRRQARQRASLRARLPRALSAATVAVLGCDVTGNATVIGCQWFVVSGSHKFSQGGGNRLMRGWPWSRCVVVVAIRCRRGRFAGFSSLFDKRCRGRRPA